MPSSLDKLVDAATEVAAEPDTMFEMYSLIIDHGTREQLTDLQAFFTGINDMIQMRLDSMPED